MTIEIAKRFIEYETVKEIWDAAHKYHSKKNDQAKIAQLVIQEGSLQQGDESVLAYANELSTIYSELDHYIPPAHDSIDREHILTYRVYHLLTSLRPEFENIRSQLCHQENPQSFEDTISQLLSEDSWLQEMKGRSEGSSYVATTLGGTTPNRSGSSTSNPTSTKKPEAKIKENLWCNYFKRRGHIKEACWKLHGRPPQAHMVTNPYMSQRGLSDG